MPEYKKHAEAAADDILNGALTLTLTRTLTLTTPSTARSPQP